ncbi:hypothetical protein RUM44_001760 [Polyplax serrata]|uniref:Osiris 9 n=1 Tax=Polyplax serrata TaxID=468196 RepID=A0ABR1AKZ6_POLSC
MRALVLVIGLVSVALAFPGGEKTPQQEEKSFLDEGLDVAYRFIKDCGDKDVSLCLKMRALTFVDRALRKNEISITDGVRLVRSEQAQESMRSLGARALSENELDNTLSKNEEEKDSQVESLLVDRIARFFQTHILQFQVPDSSINEVRKSLDEARGKKKKLKMLLPLLLLLKLKAAAIIPIALGGLALLALKALLVSKLALVLAAVLALQKLFNKNQHSSYEVVAHPVHHEEHDHGHYGRSMQDAQDLAYGAQKPQ